MNSNWTGKLSVTVPSTYTPRKKLYSQTIKASSEEAIVMYSEKIKEKCIKKNVRKNFFVNLHFGIWQLHNRLAPSQTVSWIFKEMNAFEWLLLHLVQMALKAPVKQFFTL